MLKVATLQFTLMSVNGPYLRNRVFKLDVINCIWCQTNRINRVKCIFFVKWYMFIRRIKQQCFSFWVKIHCIWRIGYFLSNYLCFSQARFIPTPHHNACTFMFPFTMLKMIYILLTYSLIHRECIFCMCYFVSFGNRQSSRFVSSSPKLLVAQAYQSHH